MYFDLVAPESSAKNAINTDAAITSTVAITNRKFGRPRAKLTNALLEILRINYTTATSVKIEPLIYLLPTPKSATLNVINTVLISSQLL